MWVLAGSFHEAGRTRARTYNTSLVFDRDGALVATYRKIHLYDVEIPGRVSYLESAPGRAGRRDVAVDVEGVRVGLSICYDLRFPELYRQLAVDGGAQVILVPAAFMMHTGGTTGRCCCAPARSRTSAMWWRPGRSGTTTRAAPASAAAW